MARKLGSGLGHHRWPGRADFLGARFLNRSGAGIFVFTGPALEASVPSAWRRQIYGNRFSRYQRIYLA